MFKPDEEPSEQCCRKGGQNVLQTAVLGEQHLSLPTRQLLFKAGENLPCRQAEMRIPPNTAVFEGYFA